MSRQAATPAGISAHAAQGLDSAVGFDQALGHYGHGVVHGAPRFGLVDPIDCTGLSSWEMSAGLRTHLPPLLIPAIQHSAILAFKEGVDVVHRL